MLRNRGPRLPDDGILQVSLVNLVERDNTEISLVRRVSLALQYI